MSETNSNPEPDPSADTNASLKKRAMRGGAWFGIAQVLDRLTAVIVLIVLARVLDDSAFGVVAQSMVAVALLQLLLSGGLVEAIVQRSEIDLEDLDSAFWTNLGLASVLTLVGLALAPIHAQVTSEPMVSPVTTALCILLPISGLGVVHEAVLARDLRFFDLAVRQVISNVIGGVVAVVVLIQGGGMWALVVQQVVARASAVAMVWYSTGWRPTARYSWRRVRSLLGFGIKAAGVRVCGFSVQRSQEALLGWKLVSDAVGQYFVAARLIDVLAKAVTLMLSRVALPTFSKVQDDLSRVRRGYLSAVQVTAAITVPAFAGVMVMAPEIVLIVVGPDWAASWPVLAWLALGGIVNSLSAYNSSVLMAVGRPGVTLKLQVFHALTHLGVVTGVLILFAESRPWMDVIVFVAAAISIRRLLYWPIPLWMIKRVTGLSLRAFARRLMGPAVSAAVMAGVLLGLKGLVGPEVPAAVVMGVGTIVGVLVYTCALILIDGAMVGRLLNDFISFLPQRALGWKPIVLLGSLGRRLRGE